MSRRRILTGRAAEGVGALRRAVTRRHPARVAYLAAGAASVGAALVRSDRTTRTVKPLLMPLLAAGVLHRAVVRGAGRAVTGSDVTSRTTGVDVALVTAGLAGAWAGDVVLMGPGSR
ncbi:lysoplasmalogenase, partial [Corynebacterium bovis]